MMSKPDLGFGWLAVVCVQVLRRASCGLGSDLILLIIVGVRSGRWDLDRQPLQGWMEATRSQPFFGLVGGWLGSMHTRAAGVGAATSS